MRALRITLLIVAISVGVICSGLVVGAIIYNAQYNKRVAELAMEPAPDPAPSPETVASASDPWWITNRSPTSTSVQWRRFSDADKLAVAGSWVKTYQKDTFTSYEAIRAIAEDLVVCADEAIRYLSDTVEMHVIAGVCLIAMEPR